MAKGRKNGCPVNVKNWLISIYDVATSKYVRIFGLESMSNSTDSDTEDGSADTDVWAEPYVTKRSGSVSLEGREVVVESTGVKDEGQELLDSYVNLSGCDADATLKFVDPYGHAWEADYIVTSREVSADNSGTTISWELEQVGEADVLPYVAVTAVAVEAADAPITTLALETGDPATILTVDFTPATASNRRFKVTNSKRKVVSIGNITENGFSVTPVSVGTSTITVTSVNGDKTASVAVTVTAPA